MCFTNQPPNKRKHAIFIFTIALLSLRIWNSMVSGGEKKVAWNFVITCTCWKILKIQFWDRNSDLGKKEKGKEADYWSVLRIWTPNQIILNHSLYQLLLNHHKLSKLIQILLKNNTKILPFEDSRIPLSFNKVPYMHENFPHRMTNLHKSINCRKFSSNLN